MDVLVAAPIVHSEVTLRTELLGMSTEAALQDAALQAIQLDPAVLEAHITLNSDGKQTPPAKARADHEDSPVLMPAAFKYDSQQAKTNTEAESLNEKVTEETRSGKFEDMMKMQKAALLSLSPSQFGLLLKYAEILRLQRFHTQKPLECAFCKKNGEPPSWYSLHALKDARGLVRCPVLRGLRCRACGATGDSAHTIKYCPLSDRDRWSC